MKKTKIVATLGPASSSPFMVTTLLKKGVNIFRINFSHGTHQQHAETIKKIRAAGEKLGIFPAIMADLQGPKIRTGCTANNAPVTLRKGKTITITTKKILCTDTELCVDYPKLLNEISKGQDILINDGLIRLRALSIDLKTSKCLCRVLNTGKYSSHKGVNFPNTDLSIPPLTAKDRKDLDFILTQDINIIALSFVRKAQDLHPLKKILKKSNKDALVIAKIEKPEAADHVKDIIKECDGIMVARGDLGVETSPFEISMIQKNLITVANEYGKIVIVATQMLESMIEHPFPTRAESTDVTNAILDGADALMLSAETASGIYPVEAVEMMSNIARSTETSKYYSSKIHHLCLKTHYPPHAICDAAAWASSDLGNVPVILFTQSGETAWYLSKIRNQSEIYAFSPDISVVNSLSMAWNTTPFLLKDDPSPIAQQHNAENILLKKKFIKKNDIVLVVSGKSFAKGSTNALRVKKVGED